MEEPTMKQHSTIRLYPDLHDSLMRIAKHKGVSYNSLVNYALARFVTAEDAKQLMAERAKRGDQAKFFAVLAKADRSPSPPGENDELPPEDPKWEPKKSLKKKG
jgi:predicted transcriptional regulator